MNKELEAFLAEAYQCYCFMYMQVRSEPSSGNQEGIVSETQRRFFEKLPFSGKTPKYSQLLRSFATQCAQGVREVVGAADLYVRFSILCIFEILIVFCCKIVRATFSRLESRCLVECGFCTGEN